MHIHPSSICGTSVLQDSERLPPASEIGSRNFHSFALVPLLACLCSAAASATCNEHLRGTMACVRASLDAAGGCRLRLGRALSVPEEWASACSSRPIPQWQPSEPCAAAPHIRPFSSESCDWRLMNDDWCECYDYSQVRLLWG